MKLVTISDLVITKYVQVFMFKFLLSVHKRTREGSCSVVVSFPVEEDTNQGSNPGGSKKIPSL